MNYYKNKKLIIIREDRINEKQFCKNRDDSIKTNIVPELTDSQKKYVYAEEADVTEGITPGQFRNTVLQANELA